jgi:hypothetical protein
MLSKVITLAGGVAGAVSFSQFSEFSQQYIQRMGGAVDELSRFVAEFDADAAELGLSREAALVELAAGGDMGRARAETVAATITRQTRLEANLMVLERAGPFTRAYEMRRFSDSEIAARAWEAYKPAVPFTFEGGVFAGAGFLSGFGLIGGLMGLLRRVFRRRVSV